MRASYQGRPPGSAGEAVEVRRFRGFGLAEGDLASGDGGMGKECDGRANVMEFEGKGSKGGPVRLAGSHGVCNGVQRRSARSAGLRSGPTAPSRGS